jgi:hypothetical protein
MGLGNDTKGRLRVFRFAKYLDLGSFGSEAGTVGIGFVRKALHHTTVLLICD